MATSKSTAAAPDAPAVDETPPYVPAVGTIVRLDDPADEGDPRFGLSIGEGLVVLLDVRAYDLPVYPLA